MDGVGGLYRLLLVADVDVVVVVVLFDEVGRVVSFELFNVLVLLVVGVVGLVFVGVVFGVVVLVLLVELLVLLLLPLLLVVVETVLVLALKDDTVGTGGFVVILVGVVEVVDVVEDLETLVVGLAGDLLDNGFETELAGLETTAVGFGISGFFNIDFSGDAEGDGVTKDVVEGFLLIGGGLEGDFNGGDDFGGTEEALDFAISIGMLFCRFLEESGFGESVS